MINSYKNSVRARCKIHGLRLTEELIEEVNESIEYPIEDLDLLLMTHSDKISPKLFDELFLELNTIDVIEYGGKPYAIEKA